MKAFISHLLCFIFLLPACLHGQSIDTITEIGYAFFKDGVPAKELREKLDKENVSLFTNDKKQRYYSLSAAINMQLRHMNKANQDLIQLLKLQPNERDRKWAVNMISGNILMLDRAESIPNIFNKIKKLIPDVRNCEIWFGIFEYLYERNDENFISIANATLNKTDRESSAYIRYVLAWYLSRKQEYKQSEKIYNELLRNDREIFSEEEVINIHFSLARSMLHDHNVEKAIAEFTKLLECNDKRTIVMSYLYLGYCYAEKKEYEKALTNFEKVRQYPAVLPRPLIEEASRGAANAKKAIEDRLIK